MSLLTAAENKAEQLKNSVKEGAERLENKASELKNAATARTHEAEHTAEEKIHMEQRQHDL